MDLDRGNSISGQKDFQIQGSWIPVTPGKPILQRPQPIYADGQGNQLDREDWVRSDGSSTGFSQENQAPQRLDASFDSAKFSEPNRGVNNWEAASAGRTTVSGNNARGNQQACIDPMAGWNNIPFVDLLAQAAMGTRPQAAVMAPSSPYDFGYNSQIGNSWPEPAYASSSPATQSLSHGSKPWTNHTFAPQMSQCQLPIQCRQTYDLNALPGTMADELPGSTIPQFAPITPDKRTSQELQNKSEVASTSVEIIELHQEKTLSQEDSSFPVVSTTVAENHNHEKESNQVIDLNMTPQQKPRRKKHRPKVITEGKPRRTRKPAVPKPDASKENPTGKRKYVRKKGLNKPSTTPPEVAEESSDPKPVEITTKSARRALNFELDGQGRNESSKRISANANPESQEQQFCSGKVQSRATEHTCQGMEVTVENSGAGIAYDLVCSTNKHLKDYISLPTRQAPSTPPPTNTNLPHEKLKANNRSQNDEETGQITADDKLGRSEQIILKSNKILAPRSPNDSNCSTTANLAGGQATARKRQCTDVLDMEDPSAMNLSGAEYNGVHSYHAFHVQDFNNKISGMFFPDICKKRRTEKGQTSTTSSTSSSVTTAKNVVKLVQERLQNQTNASILESKANCWISSPQVQTNRAPTTQAEAVQAAAMDRVQTFECMLALGDKERLTKKRSKGPTRVRDLASLIGIAESKLLPTLPGKQALLNGEAQGAEVSHRPQNCVEALNAENHATFARRKRSKKQSSLISSVSSSRNAVQIYQNNVLYSQHKILSKQLGPPPEVIWKHMLTIDAITERLKHLDINLEGNIVPYQEYNALVPYNTRYQSQNALVPYRVRKQEQNALVIYRSDGTVVPFDGSFYPIKKRRPRPKVDLDEETNKVWKLLLENINNEGIDGTDEQKARWWEEERRVFRGRADSFIARMHLVQGDRRFSKWKGSVVDSVVGVFLTQNVSDHLSSSAYMSLAAHFPLKPKSNGQQSYEEGTSILVEEPELCMLDLEDTIKWKEIMPDNLVCDQFSMTLNDPEHNEEKEVVNSIESLESSPGCLSSNDDSKSRLDSFRSDLENFHESTTQHMDRGTACVMRDRTAMEDVISSQSSVDSSIAQPAERRPGQCSISNSDAQDPATVPKSTSFNTSTSFLELLQMAVVPKLNQGHNHESCLGQSDKSLVDAQNQPDGMGYDKQSQNMGRLDGPESPIVASIMPSSDHHSTLTPNSRSQEVDCIECLEEESRSSESNKKDENRMSNRSAFFKESSSTAVFRKKLTVSVHELPKVSQDNVQTTSNFTTNSNETEQSQGRPVEEPKNVETLTRGKNNGFQQNKLPNFSGEISDVTESTSAFNNQKNTEHRGAEPNLKEQNHGSVEALNETTVDALRAKRKRVGKEKNMDFDWDSLRKQAQANGLRERTANTMDSLDWEAVRCADVGEIANTIKERGMNNMLAERIKDFLNRLVREHGSLDLEWLRDVPPDKAKEYLLSIRGLGLKSVECVRLLTLHHLAFPVDTNVGRIAVRLGWVPLQPLPESLQLHLLELYPVLESIQKYLWPRLCKLDQRTLYELHYQMITFGKVFCTKSKPNCNACPMRGECRHFASAFASARLALPGPEEKSIVSATENTAGHDPAIITSRLQLPPPQVNQHLIENNQLEATLPTEAKSGTSSNEPIIEEPATPELECTQISETDIEDTCFEDDPDEIPTIKLNIEEFTQNLQDYMQKNMELQEGDMSRALVALTPEAASLPTPKLKNISRLRTEHQVYELPDSHPLLQGLDKREPDDPCSYLLAIWTPGETANSIQPPEGSCISQEVGKLCSETTCFSCNSIREANSQTVRGTLLIPCRTAMRGSFPLNGTYFQVNEVFADHDSSLSPIDVPRAWIWNLPRRTVYFGTSIPTIFKGLTTEGIQYCFWRGFVCVRGFDQKTRAPRPLIARLHFPASKLIRTKATANEE